MLTEKLTGERERGKGTKFEYQTDQNVNKTESK